MKHKLTSILSILFSLALAACSGQPAPKAKTPLETLQDKVTLSCAKSTAKNAATTCRDARVELATFVRDESNKEAQATQVQTEKTAFDVFQAVDRNAKATVRAKDLEGWYIHLDSSVRIDYRNLPAHVQSDSPAVMEYQKAHGAAWKSFEESREASQKARENTKAAIDLAFQQAKSIAEAEWLASPEGQEVMKLAEEERKKEMVCPDRQSATERAYTVREAETSKAYRVMEDAGLKDFKRKEQATTDLFVERQIKLFPLMNQAYHSDKSAWYAWLDAKDRQSDGGEINETVNLLKVTEQHPVISVYLQAEKALHDQYKGAKKLAEESYTRERKVHEGVYAQKRKATDEVYQKALEQARMTRC